MRGQESRHRWIVPSRPAAKAGANDHLSPDDWQVVHDLDGDFPVTDAELAAIEAFLLPALQAILQSSKPSSDSKEPQRPVEYRGKATVADHRP